MKLFKLIFIFMVSISLSSHFSWAAAQVVHLDGDRLTLDVQKQPLSAILEKLSDQGIRILIDPRINPKISATFVNRPLGKALNSILRSVNYAFIWKKDDASGSDEPRLWEIRIFYKGQGERIRLLKKSTPSVVATGGGVYHMKETLLVKLAPAMTEAALATLLDKLGATIVDRHVALGIIKLRLPQGADVAAITAAVTGYPGVVAVGPDYAYPLESGNPILIDGSSSPALSTPVFSEGGTRVAVMDSGLLASYEDNPYVQGAYDAVSPGALVNDLLGHGTQMALIAAGVVNPLGVEADTTATSPVVAVRVIGDGGFTSDYTLICGIDYAIQEEARVISLSWGSETASPMLETAIDYAAEKGLILVAAAGNVPTGKPVYPAAYENVIGVGALTPDGKPWKQSNYGDFVTLYAPGLADLPVGYEGGPGTYAGTSIATAYVAHLVASILDKIPDADMETILLNLAMKH
jgi:thermitase